MIRATLIAMAVVLCLACGGREPRRYHVETVADGLSSPVFAAIQPGTNGRIVVIEQDGRVIALDGTMLVDLRSETEEAGERGLLGLAFHPDYPRDDRVFVNLTDRSDGATRILEIHLPVDGRASKPTELLRIEQPYANHNGGMLAFATDGLLYIGTGDGGSAGDPENRAQDPIRPARQDPEARRRSGRLAAGDLGARPAQPVAVLVRSGERRPLDRRRGPERVGGDRRPARRHRSGGEPRLAPLRGHEALQRRPGPRAASWRPWPSTPTTRGAP